MAGVETIALEMKLESKTEETQVCECTALSLLLR